MMLYKKTDTTVFAKNQKTVIWFFKYMISKQNKGFQVFSWCAQC